MYSRKSIPAPFGVSPQKREKAEESACIKAIPSAESEKNRHGKGLPLLAILLLPMFSAKKE